MGDLFDKSLENEDIDSLLQRIDQLFIMDTGVIPIMPEQTQASPVIDLKKLESDGFLPAQLQEVSLGLKENLSVEYYASGEYNWMQMREIRLGLQMGLNVSKYLDVYYSPDQMREIRLGLLAGIDVTPYASLLYSLTDMKKQRMHLISEAYRVNPEGFERTIHHPVYDIDLQISADCMEAVLVLPELKPSDKPPFYPVLQDVQEMLYENGICYGIRQKELTAFLMEYTSRSSLVVASGKRPGAGRSGKYEIFFKIDKEVPKELPDGRIDYSQVMVAETVQQGQRLVHYTKAKRGLAGKTITGITVEGASGEELMPLSCTGVLYDPQKEDYFAMYKGQVYFDESTRILNVHTTYILNSGINRYNGRLSYDGAMIINGDVQEGSELIATGDIVINGHVESACITSSQNVVIRGGMNAGGIGIITAGGKVVGDFFEATTIKAIGTVEANYFLNCVISTDEKIIARGSKARILGGTLTSFLGIESNLIEPSGTSKMTIDIGDLYVLDQRIRAADAAAKAVSAELSSLNTGKQKLSAMFGDNVNKNILYQQSLMAISQKENELIRHKREKEYAEALRKRAMFASVRAMGKLQAVVYVTINGRTRKINEDIPRALLTPQNIKGDEKHGKK